MKGLMQQFIIAIVMFTLGYKPDTSLMTPTSTSNSKMPLS